MHFKQEDKQAIELSVTQQAELGKLVLLKKSQLAIRMMMVWCLLAEVKKTNLSALVICWEESNDC